MFRMTLTLPLLFITTLFIMPPALIVKPAVAHSAHSFNVARPRSLCTQGEQVLWSCVTLRGGKLASLCGSRELDETRGYVQYRFGRAGRVELEFPRERLRTQSAFRYSRYTRPLVTYLKVEFTNDGFTYTIRDDSNSEEKPARRDASITVKPAGESAKESVLGCRLPIAGSLMKLETVVPREDWLD